MVYIGVEFYDYTRGRKCEFWAKVPYEETDMDPIAYDGGLLQEFDDWVEDGVDPEWTEEQKEEYYEHCEWWWWPLDDEEIKMYEERSNKL